MGMGIMSTARDLTGTKIAGLRVTGRSQMRPLRWSTKCLSCGSTKNFDHASLLAAEAGARNIVHCGLDECYLFHRVSMPNTTPEPRPDHADDYPAPAPVVKPVTVKPAPKPVDPRFLLYKRFCLASRSPEWGNREPCDFQTFKLLDGHPNDLARIISEIETWEAEEAERQRGRDGVAQIEREIMENLFFGYGKELVSNENRR